MSRMPITFVAVVQFCRSALARVPTTLIAVTTAIIKTAINFARTGVSGTISLRYALNATAQRGPPRRY